MANGLRRYPNFGGRVLGHAFPGAFGGLLSRIASGVRRSADFEEGPGPECGPNLERPFYECAEWRIR